MPEQYFTRFSTTVGGGGYTSGSGVLNVASTSGTTAPFRVLITNASTGAYIALLKVTAVNSSTQYAVTTDPGGTDANASSGDNVYAVVTADALTAIVAPSGGTFGPINNQNNTSTNWQDASLLACIRGDTLRSFPSSWKVRMRFTAGSPVIGGMKILRTLCRDTSVIDSTTVQIGGNSAPTLTTPTLVDTDTISLALDGTHDYWFVIYFTNVSANASVTVVANGPSNVRCGYAAGDKTGVSTIPSITTTNDPYLVIGAILP